MSSLCTFMTERGHPLLWAQKPLKDRSVLTVENYCKWYSLYLLTPTWDIIKTPFPSDDDLWNDPYIGPPYSDHIPNPKVVMRYAEKNSFHLDENALEMIIGRWEIEHLNNYQPEE